MIKCSLVVPVYDKEQWIRETINSIVQNHGIPDNEFECILVDGPSSVELEKIYNEFTSQYQYIRYYSIPSTEIYQALNFGKSMASGKYVMFLDGKDGLCDNFIPQACAFLENNEDDFYVGNRLCDEQVWYPSPDQLDLFGPWLSSCMFNKHVTDVVDFEDIKSYDIIYTKKVTLAGYKFYYNESNPPAFNDRMIPDSEPDYGEDWIYNIVKYLQYSEKYKFCVTDNHQIIEKDSKKIYYLEFYANETCNLNCKFCANFSSIAKPQPPVPIDEIIEELKPLVHLRDDIRGINILGGEPLINPNISNILYVVREMFPNTELRLITNGLLYKKLWKLKDAIVDNNIMVILSIYPVENADDIYKAFVDSVPAHLLNQNKYPITFGFYCKHLMEDTHHDMERIYHCMLRNKCTRLKGNKLYLCEYAANLQQLKDYFANEHINISGEGTYMEIDENTTADEIRNFCYTTVPDICYHCANVLQEDVENNIKWWDSRPWSRTERKLEEFYIKSSN